MPTLPQIALFALHLLCLLWTIHITASAAGAGLLGTYIPLNIKNIIVTFASGACIAFIRTGLLSGYYDAISVAILMISGIIMIIGDPFQISPFHEHALGKLNLLKLLAIAIGPWNLVLFFVVTQ